MRIQKLKTTGLIALFACISFFVNAQTTDVQLTYNESATLLLNGTPLNDETTIESLIKTIGEPSKKVESKNGETAHFYEETGVVFFAVEGLVKGVGVNFNWDGDEKFPEKSFTGSLNIGEASITKETKSEAFAAIKSVGFICPIPLMCATTDREASINCSAAFQDTKLTQVVFLMR